MTTPLVAWIGSLITFSPLVLALGVSVALYVVSSREEADGPSS